MIQKDAAAQAVLALLALALSASGQASRPSSARSQNKPTSAATAAQAAPAVASAAQAPAATPATTPATGPGDEQAPSSANPAASNAVGSPAARTDCFGGNCDFQQPHIAISTPAPAPAAWPWQERIAWGANIVLVVLGYVAILMGISLLRKIERQTGYAEEAAQAATESARAALKQAEALERAERPWILMSVRPSPQIENGFTVMATNRGRGPARIATTVDEVVCAIDESHLAATPIFKNEPVAPADPMILLPGESTDLLAFSRTDVEQVCADEERLKRVENWEEKLFLYGKVTYRDLAAPEGTPAHESSWFCWYIHGRQKSGMVMAGPPAYNRHT